MVLPRPMGNGMVHSGDMEGASKTSICTGMPSGIPYQVPWVIQVHLPQLQVLQPEPGGTVVDRATVLTYLQGG